MQRTKSRMNEAQIFKKRAEGFTIIEVLIVLAIAGLILLIVFLAVPALQRNSRNTQRRSDVSRILAAVAESSANSNASLPATNAQFSAAFANSTPKLGYYTTPANITWTNPGAAAAVTDPASLDKVKVANYAKCDPATGLGVAAGGTARGVVAVFDVESSGGNLVPQCIEG